MGHQLLRLLLEPIEGCPLCLHLRDPLHEFFVSEVIILLLLAIHGILDDGLVYHNGWVFRIEVVSDRGMLVETSIGLTAHV